MKESSIYFQSVDNCFSQGICEWIISLIAVDDIFAFCTVFRFSDAYILIRSALLQPPHYNQLLSLYTTFPPATRTYQTCFQAKNPEQVQKTTTQTDHIQPPLTHLQNKITTFLASHLPSPFITTFYMNSSTANAINTSQTLSIPLLASGQNHYYPKDVTPRTFFHFEKTEVMQYLNSIKWVSLKWFTIARFLIFFGFLTFTYFLINTHVNPGPNYDQNQAFWYSPYFIFHCLSILFYTILIGTIVQFRTTLKQMHEYTQRLDPIPTTPLLKFAHILYTLLITLQPIFIIFEYIFSHDRSPIRTNISTGYVVFSMTALLFEIIINNIPLLWPHIFFVYLFGMSYYAIIFSLHKWKNVTFLHRWFDLLDSDDKYLPITISMLLFALFCSVLIFCLWRQFKRCKKERNKVVHNEAVYFFNTSNYGTNLKLNSSIAYHVEVETTISPQS
jgi:hypothetical protein